jgi:hypothetical protein
MDLLTWAMPDAKVTWDHISSGENQSILLKGQLSYPGTDQKTFLDITFRRGHSQGLVNRIKVDTSEGDSVDSQICWGYFFTIPEGYVYSRWDHAYTSSLYSFYNLVNGIGEYDVSNP